MGAEIFLSTLVAPLLLLLQSRAVAQVLLGLDGGWPATHRSARGVDLRDAWAHSWWIVAFGFSLIAVTMAMAPHAVTWMLPVALPMVLAPVLISISALGAHTGVPGFLFRVPQEHAPTPVMLERRRILMQWRTHATSGIVPTTGKARFGIHARA
jgi:membrane glycosyltransferase